jgi:outer membrane protein TolC
MQCLRFLCASLALLPACRGTPTADENAARDALAQAQDSYRPEGERPPLPALRADSPLDAFLRYAALRSPRVEARFHAWAAAVEETTLARSLPDPSLTLMAEFWDTLDELVPGLVQEVPARSKRLRAAEAQSRVAGARRREFEAEVAATLARTRAACAEAAFREESITIARDVLRIAGDVVELARARFRVAQVTQQDVLRAEIEQDQLANELVGLEDDRNVLRARLRDALGIPPGEPDPPLPKTLARDALALPDGDLVAAMLARNPELGALAEEVRAAESLVALARAQARPEVTAGLGVNVVSPGFVRPELGITLPIWADKIEAGIASAVAIRSRAGAQLEGEKLRLVVRLAEASFAHRDAIRRIRLLQEKLLPKAGDSLQIARAAYGSGASDLTALLDAERALYGFRVDEARAWMEREVAHAQVLFELLGRVPGELAFVGDKEGDPR